MTDNDEAKVKSSAIEGMLACMEADGLPTLNPNVVGSLSDDELLDGLTFVTEHEPVDLDIDWSRWKSLLTEELNRRSRSKTADV